ncbi:MAG: toxin co-regulated pilus biosynthesis Q family protein [Betaproteobacteria bacterium]|nr:toxin co-regulated pilus biosynthesis Q family protein [Betaproteobacteria bacterium]
MKPMILKLFFFITILALSTHVMSDDNAPGIFDPVTRVAVQPMPSMAPLLPVTNTGHNEKTPVIDVDSNRMVFRFKESVSQGEWVLTAGDTIKKDLRMWAAKAGWNVVWNVSRDWVIPSNSLFYGEFQNAAEQVIKTLAGNGALVHAQLYLANQTMVVTGAPE